MLIYALFNDYRVLHLRTFVVKSTSVLKSQANFVNVKSLIGPIPKIPS